MKMGGFTVRWMSEQVGISHSAVARILSGDTSTPRDPLMLDKMMGAMVEAKPELESKIIPNRGMLVIPVYPGIAAGEAAYQIADVEEDEIPEPDDNFPRWGRIVTGDSMMPVLRSGDTAVFKGMMPEPGYVVHAYRDGDDVVKCLRDIQGRRELHSFNPDYLPLIGDWKVKGLCVGIIRRVSGGRKVFYDAPRGLTWSDRDGIEI